MINATYNGMNGLLTRSGIAPLPLKHEITEMCLIDLPPELEGHSVTVMCGPFFSVMPFPARGCATLSHVRYTPHAHWVEPGGPDTQTAFENYPRRTRFPAMVRDAARYLPALAEARYRDSLWEIKTVLPSQEKNDGRPILCRRDHGGVRGLTCVMGGKIDNIYDVIADVTLAAKEAVSS